MPKRIYVGSHAEVSLPDGTICKRGEPVEIPESIDIKELEVSGNWTVAGQSTKDPKE
jgi:hypothetical protein